MQNNRAHIEGEESLDDLLRLTEEALAAFYRHDGRPLIARMDPDCIIIGASGMTEGVEQAKRTFVERSGTPVLHLKEPRFRIVGQSDRGGDRDAHIVGTYRLYSAPTDPMLHSVSQRITAYFRRVNGLWRALLIHVSSENNQKVEAELFPIETSRATYDYVRRILQTGRKAGILPSRIVAADGATVHYFDPDDILYVKAQGKHCLVHGITGEQPVNALLGEMAEQLPGTFIRAHRSYLVNSAHIKSIVRYSLTLSDGTVVPVPRQRYEQIRREISLRVAGS